MPGVNFGPVVVGSFALAALTFLVYRSAQRVRLVRAAGHPTPRSFVAAVVAYVAAWVAYVVVIASVVRGDL